MVQIRVYTREDREQFTKGTVLNHLRPRSYMCGYSFDQVLKYVKKELSCEGIDEKDIVSFEIFDRNNHWCQPIEKKGCN